MAHLCSFAGPASLDVGPNPALLAHALDVLRAPGDAHRLLTGLPELVAQLAGADVALLAVTDAVDIAPDGWYRIGGRAALRQWVRPGASPAYPGPARDLPAEQAWRMPYLSQCGRAHDVVVVDDVAALPAEADADRAELARAGAGAYLATSFVGAGAHRGSLALLRATPGPWPEDIVAAIQLLGVGIANALTLAAEQRALAAALDRAAAARDTQQRFFSAISHELRTPLNAVVGLSETVAEEVAAAGHTEWADDLAVVTASALHLSNVVDDLLTEVRALARDDQREPAPVAAAVADAVHWVGAPAAARGVTVEVDVPCDLEVAVPPTALRRILANLIGNAVTYNRPGGWVRVHATLSRTAQLPAVRIAVTDSGPGMSQDETRRIWEPFVRLAAAGSGGPEGTGLGLPLSRTLAERHGGLMGVDSTLGEGSTFWVELPTGGPAEA